MKTSKYLVAILALFLPLSAFAVSEPDNFEHASFMKYEEPIFPPSLKFDGITDGHVEIMIDINDDGTVADWIPLRSTHRLLTESVGRSLANWRFNPAKIDGEPVPVAQRIIFNFDHSGTVLISGTGMDLHMRWIRELGREDDRLAFELPDLDQLPEPVEIVRPLLPKEMAEKKMSGKVMVSFYIDRQGNVRIPVAIDWEGDIMFAQSAIHAITQWKFKPPTRRGRAVVVRAIQPFHFKPSTQAE
jgi:TonB family protein